MSPVRERLVFSARYSVALRGRPRFRVLLMSYLCNTPATIRATTLLQKRNTLQNKADVRLVSYRKEGFIMSPPRKLTVNVSISLPPDMNMWLRAEGMNKIGGASQVIRELIEARMREETAAPLYLATPAPPRLNVAENLAAVAVPTPSASGKATTKPARYKLRDTKP